MEGKLSIAYRSTTHLCIVEWEASHLIPEQYLFQFGHSLDLKHCVDDGSQRKMVCNTAPVYYQYVLASNPALSDCGFSSVPSPFWVLTSFLQTYVKKKSSTESI